MSDTKTERNNIKKRIFYCNITYGCNSNCIFCYSHNTWHNSIPHKEIDIDSYIEYLANNDICESDRIIVNGGEPILHSRIAELLERLNLLGCEVLVYTNGRLLTKLNLEMLSERFRFIVPIHGFQVLHDKITGVNGSYAETIRGLQYITKPESKCRVDIKIIINGDMVSDHEQFQYTLDSLTSVPLNNAVHITKMADTIISQKNNCESINDEIASEYTRKLYDYYAENYKVKIFDTCIKGMKDLVPGEIDTHCLPLKVYFKDLNQEYIVNLEKPIMACMDKCELSKKCQTAVGEYTTLEFWNHDVYIELE